LDESPLNVNTSATLYPPPITSNPVVVESYPGQMMMEQGIDYNDSNSYGRFSAPSQQGFNQGYYDWQFFPQGLIYHSYLAAPKESRMGVQYQYEKNQGWLIDATIGGRFGLLRYGTNDIVSPQGWQLDFEAAAMPRLAPGLDLDLISTDYRYGIPLTYGYGKWKSKLAFYHLSSHLGDEFLIKNPTFNRLNYVRDAIVLGQELQLDDNWLVYGEAAYSFRTDGGAKPWEFQFGVEFSPLRLQGPRGIRGFGPWAKVHRGMVVGAPFVAANGHLREEVNYSGDLTFQTGWQWRNPFDGRLLRIGVHFLTGPSPQYEFFSVSERQIGLGLWYDY
jgi:hypothetical protein